jgi:ATP-dependent Clp protease adaptor protein ClpS
MKKSKPTIRQHTEVRIPEPQKHNVVLYNDDYTTLDFMIMVLKTVFHKTDEEAEQIMNSVHNQGKEIAGTYSFDIAVSKANKATRMAREENYPLKLTVEEA